MNFYKMPDYEGVCRKTAGLIAAQIQIKPNSVIAMPTGSTPIGVFKKLVETYERGDLDFSEAVSFNLDEYLGVPQSAPQSFHTYMNHHLLDKVNISKDNCHFPDGCAEKIDVECKRYEKLIESCGGIDLMFLGIGSNGHIAFNEPEPVFSVSTHVISLTEESIRACAPAFEGQTVPTKAISMGIKTIMMSKKIILAANGAAKKDIMRSALYGPITPSVPASVLQLHHDLTVVWSDN